MAGRTLSVLLTVLIRFEQAGASTVDVTLAAYGEANQVKARLFLAAAVAFDLDFQKNYNDSLRSRLGPPVINIPNLSQRLRLRLMLGNSDSKPQMGVRMALDFFLGNGGFPKIHGLIGGGLSSISMPIASVGMALQVPQVAWGSTAAALSNKDQYGYFMRTSPRDGILALWSYISFFGFRGAAVLYTGEPYGESIYQTLRSRALEEDRAGVLSGVVMPYMPQGYDRGMSQAALLNLERAGKRLIIVAIATSQYTDVWPDARAAGLFSGVYQVTGTNFGTWLGLSGIDSLSVVGGLHMVIPNGRGSLFDTFEQLWKQLTPADIISQQERLGLDLWPAAAPFVPEEVLQSWFDLSPDMTFAFVPFLFDAGYAFLHAMNSLVLEGFTAEQMRGKALLDKLYQTTFEGVTGKVAFDSNGDRLGNYDLMVMVMNQSDSTGSFETVGLYEATADAFEMYRDPLWMDGTIAAKAPESLAACLPGSSVNQLTGECQICQVGTFSNVSSAAFCEACAVGRVAADWGSITCVPCTAGKFTDLIQQEACMSCSAGSYSGGGASSCTLCEKGKYAERRESAECTACSGSFTTEFIGALDPEACLCPDRTYRDASERDRCVACPEGMTCSIGSDAAWLDRAVKGQCGGSQACTAPKLSLGFMALVEEPMQVYACLSVAACPGGLPGTCADGHDPASVACASCLSGFHLEGGRCVPCTSEVFALPLVLVVLALVGACVGLSFAGNRDRLVRGRFDLFIVLHASLVMFVVQTMGVFGSIQVEWFEPLASLFRIASMFSFKLDVFSLSCIHSLRSSLEFLMSIMVVPTLCCILLAALILEKVLLKRKFNLKTESFNTVGTVYSVLNISIALTIVRPFICFKHPGDSGSSVRSFPSVLCWQSGEFESLVSMAVIDLLIVFAPFLATVFYGTWNYRFFITSSMAGSHCHLQKYHFLFGRFTPERYYFGSFTFLRNLAICLVPVVVPMDAAFQVCLVSLILLVSMHGTLSTQPWRHETANVTDGALTGLMVLFLVCGAATLDTNMVEGSLQSLALIMLISTAVCALSLLARAVWNRLVPAPWYEFFLCHHKQDAAAQMRYLKILLNSRGRTVFVDSDDLTDLGALFATVQSSVACLVVYLTKDVLTRPWCAGEIASATAKGLKMAAVRRSDFVRPTHLNEDNLAEYLDLSSTSLSEYYISAQSVLRGFDHLFSQAVRSISVPEHICGLGKFVCISEELQEQAGGNMYRDLTASREPSDRKGIVISSDTKDDEATAAAGILVSKLQPKLRQTQASEVLVLANMPEISHQQAESLIQSNMAVVVMLSANSLYRLEQLKAIIAAACGGVLLLPVTMPSFNFPTPKFIDESMPLILGSSSSAELEALHSCFKKIAINLSTMASDAVLEVQVQQVALRITSRKEAPTALASPQSAGKSADEVSSEHSEYSV